MSKVEAMLAAQGVPLADDPTPGEPEPPYPGPVGPPPHVRRGPLLRWVRQGPRRGLWRPWWLLGLVEVVTYPLPRFRAGRGLYVPGCRASCGLPPRSGAMLVVP